MFINIDVLKLLKAIAKFLFTVRNSYKFASFTRLFFTALV